MHAGVLNLIQRLYGDSVVDESTNGGDEGASFVISSLDLVSTGDVDSDKSFQNMSIRILNERLQCTAQISQTDGGGNKPKVEYFEAQAIEDDDDFFVDVYAGSSKTNGMEKWEQVIEKLSAML